MSKENWTRTNPVTITLQRSEKHGWWAVIEQTENGYKFTIGTGKRRYFSDYPYIELSQAKYQALHWINWIAETEIRLASCSRPCSPGDFKDGKCKCDREAEGVTHAAQGSGFPVAGAPCNP